MPRLLPVHRQRILISGASAGLGRAMAERWAADGRHLALAARRLPELESVRERLLAAHPGITVSVHQLDVTDHEAVDAVVADATAALGGLDRVVVNAGVAAGGSLGLADAAGNRATAQTNFLGALHQAEAAVRHFRTVGRGHLAFVSSVSALRGMAGTMNVYGATKAGVSALAEGLRSDLWDTAIRVSAVHPGYVSTALGDHLPRPILVSDLPRASRALVAAIDSERPSSYVPAWPWSLLAVPIRLLPLGLYRRVAG